MSFKTLNLLFVFSFPVTFPQKFGNWCHYIPLYSWQMCGKKIVSYVEFLAGTNTTGDQNGTMYFCLIWQQYHTIIHKICICRISHRYFLSQNISNWFRCSFAVTVEFINYFICMNCYLYIFRLKYIGLANKLNI